MRKALTQETVVGILISLFVLALILGGFYLGISGKLGGIVEGIRGSFRS